METKKKEKSLNRTSMNNNKRRKRKRMWKLYLVSIFTDIFIKHVVYIFFECFSCSANEIVDGT